MNAGTARVSVSVAVEPAVAFAIFTQDLDRWWRRGIKFRHAGRHAGLIAIEPRVDGRLFESFDGDGTAHVIEVGRVRVWDPPHLLVFSWRNENYSPDETTEVQVEFVAGARGTQVTVTHRGLTALRPDHPARHGLPDTQFIRMIALWWGEQMASLQKFAKPSAHPTRV